VYYLVVRTSTTVCPRNEPLCVDWDVKLYTLTHRLPGPGVKVYWVLLIQQGFSTGITISLADVAPLFCTDWMSFLNSVKAARHYNQTQITPLENQSIIEQHMQQEFNNLAEQNFKKIMLVSRIRLAGVEFLSTHCAVMRRLDGFHISCQCHI